MITSVAEAQTSFSVGIVFTQLMTSLEISVTAADSGEAPSCMLSVFS